MIDYVWEPEVYIVGRQQVDRAAMEKFLADEDAAGWVTDTLIPAEELVEAGGRTCFMSFRSPRPGGNKAYIDHILEVGHHSVAEHAVWSFVVTGISRSVSHEAVRHRIGISPSMLSQRYVDESDARFVVHPELKEEVRQALLWERLGRHGGSLTPEILAGMHWLDSVRASAEKYVSLVDYLAQKVGRLSPEATKSEARKFARQAARDILPNATETKIFFTANARALRHFIELRASRYADPAIRSLACKVYQAFLAESPHLFGDYEEVTLWDGTHEVVPKNRKV